MKQKLVLFSVLAAVGLLSCTSTNQEKKEDTYKVIHPTIKDTAFITQYVAEINAIQNVEVRARIDGFIENLYVDEGQTVKKGQTLFTISSREYQQALVKAKANTRNAEAELKSAMIELESSQRLFSKKIIGKPEYELAQASLDALKAKLEEAKSDEEQAALNLTYINIKAPFDGVINRIPNKVGSLIEEGTLLTTISNNKEVYAYYQVSEKEYLDYIFSKNDENATTVSLLLANGVLYKHKGKIETIESEFDRSTGNIAFRAKFLNSENILKHGSSGKVLVKTKLKNAMLIPQKSTFEVQENIYVFVVTPDNKVKQQRVIPIARIPHYYAIEHTLNPNDKIIYEGIQRVQVGETIISEVTESNLVQPSKP